MSRYSGHQGRGAARRARDRRREQAADRNDSTPWERTADFRRRREQVRAAIDVLVERGEL